MHLAVGILFKHKLLIMVLTLWERTNHLTTSLQNTSRDGARLLSFRKKESSLGKTEATPDERIRRSTTSAPSFRILMFGNFKLLNKIWKTVPCASLVPVCTFQIFVFLQLKVIVKKPADLNRESAGDNDIHFALYRLTGIGAVYSVLEMNSTLENPSLVINSFNRSVTKVITVFSTMKIS